MIKMIYTETGNVLPSCLSLQLVSQLLSYSVKDMFLDAIKKANVRFGRSYPQIATLLHHGTNGSFVKIEKSL